MALLLAYPPKFLSLCWEVEAISLAGNPLAVAAAHRANTLDGITFTSRGWVLVLAWFRSVGSCYQVAS